VRKAIKVTLSIFAIASAIIGLAIAFLKPVVTPKTKTVVIVQPQHLGSDVYTFETPGGWPQYAASLAVFRGKNPELECHRDGGYQSGTYHILSCSDPAIDAQSVTIP
jgi:hypothetical protein